MAPSNFLLLPLLLSISLLLLFSSSGAARVSSLSTLSSSSYSTTSPKSDIDSAIVGINKTVSETTKLAKFIHKMQKKYKDGFEANVLNDCNELIQDSKGLMKNSVKALKKYKHDGKVMHVGDAQTWLSAALTDVDTCYDEIKEGSNEELKDAIGKKIEDVETLMDVSLERINDLRA
ncbi:hypothetical protein AAC387_Pa09g2400 [Persea americana]